MSLDVYLLFKEPQTRQKSSGIFVRENGQINEITREEWNRRNPGVEPAILHSDDVKSNEAYSSNITHNLSKMAGEAGIYEHLWRPDDINITKASQLIEPLRHGLHRLKSEPDRYRKFNPENGWGSYDSLVEFVEKYLDACYKHPESDIKVSR